MKIKTGHKFRIGTNTFTFLWMPEDSDYQGKCDFTKRRVKIYENSIDHMNTFIHEVLHAIDMEHILNLNETQITIIADHLIDFCITNDVDLRDTLEAQTKKD